MQQKQRKKRTALLTGLLTLCTLWMGWGQMTVSYDFSDPGAVPGLDADPPIALDANIGFSSHKNNGTSNPGIFSEQLRLYQNATKGGSIKIYAQNGVTITNVVVYASGSDGDGPAGYSVDNDTEVGTFPDGTTTYTMSNLTATNYVEFYNKGTSTSTRTYVDIFEVTYTLPSSGPTLLTNTTTLTNFEYIEGSGPSASQSLDVSGINLDPAAGDINVAAPANFEVSLDDNTFADDVDMAYTAGEFTDETVYVRLKSGLAVNTYTGDIIISGGDATDVTVALSGEVTPLFIGTIETFANSNATASYNDSSFVGNGGIPWTYVHSRDANNDANGSGIDLPALMLRHVANDSKITSEPIPGGIGDFSVKLYKGFTGGGNRQVELFINGVSQGTSTPFNDYNEHIFTVNGININVSSI